ncbi:PilW family protein [Ferriphaselus sp. R-1]|uniref:PilW family protein n=1 Tax=Ferriphaselus sp. R-1 TaxID=1485544 RepID=UPI0013770AE9|nr:PilW family protein [Ferriphaselus sp. R-1]
MRAIPRRQSGFSLVDVMVGMVLGLIGTIVIFQVFESSERIKRTSTSGNDAQQNGAVAMFALERALKEAGYGMNGTDANPVPVQITFGNAAAVPDTLTVSYRRNWDYGPFVPSAAGVLPVPPALTVETYSLNNQAQLVSNLNGVLADGIVQLKAEYGVDTTAIPDGIMDAWQTALPINPLTVLAVRLVLVARSAQPEKPAAGAACATTTVAPLWSAGSVILTGNLGLAGGDSWNCYRYKTFQVTVPLRNVLWR